MPEEQSGAHYANLEKEFTCSICTEILYQPLTLLDCLHTFCGACLKEWFRSQASRATSLHPYTCPACRASVRGTRHNATVSSLLDIILQNNPSKARPQEDKDEQDKIYKPGDNVLPKLRRRVREREHEEDQRVLHDVLQASFEEAVGGNSETAQPLLRARRRTDGSSSRRGSGETEQPESRQVGMYLHNQSQPRTRGRTSPRSSPHQSPIEPVPGRSVEHQSSLRSLLSVSDADIEDEIMRQIAEDGLLSGVDLNNLTAPQEDELTERIAQAYRRRRGERRRQRSRDNTREISHQSSGNSGEQLDTSTTTAQISPRRSPRRRDQDRTQRQGQSQDTGHVSDNPDARRSLQIRQRPRSGSQPSQSRVRGPRVPSRSPVRPTTSSANPAQSPESAQRSSRPPETARRTTDPPAGTSSRQRRPQESSNTSSETPRRLPPRADSDSTSTATPGLIRISPRLNSSTFPREDRSTLPSQSVLSATAPRTESPVQSNANAQVPLTMYEEPSVSCRNCQKPKIQYDIHYRCTKCDPNGFDVCQSCYRGGKGCNNWFGFGWSAMPKYERQKSQTGVSTTDDLPHVLTARRYLIPRSSEAPNAEGQIMTSDDPSKRLQQGVFCDICSEFANSWYWHCNMCNEGEWGFCNRCVNQGKHCTHPLLSLEYKVDSNANTHTPNHTYSTTLKLSSVTPSPPYHARPFKTNCDRCNYLIQPSVSRFHCTQCNTGDYDIHVDCYISLVKGNQISPDNGHQGWRRCLNGHRMVVLGFEDRDGGRQARIVVRDCVGGQALKEENGPGASVRQNESTPQHAKGPSWSWKDPDGVVRNHRHHRDLSSGGTTRDFPPDGGVGLKLVAAWSYYPEVHVKDELMFPKGAEIREAEDINGDWFWGVYAGMKGLFPGNYARVIGRT